MATRTKLFFDGGCRPNPGPIELAVVLRGTAHLFTDGGAGTNTDAEWLALIRALKLAQAAGLADFVLVGDALEVITGARAVLAGGRPANHHAATFADIVRNGPGPIPGLRWCKRAQNLAGIALAARHPR